MTAEATVESTIAEAWAQANDAQLKAQTYSDNAVSAASSFIITAEVPTITMPTKPTVPNLPTDDLGTQFSAEYAASMAELKALLEDRLKDFLDTYYPNFSTRLQTIADWIDNAITNGGTGLPAAIENAIWDRARSRLDKNSMRAEEEVIDFWASRGFGLPPGIAVAKTQEIQQENQNQSNALSRDIAIKQAEMEVENVRFAISTGANLQLGILQAAVNYMNAIIAVASHANSKANSLVNAISALYGLTAQYVNAAVNAENLILRYDTANVERQLTINELDIKAFQAKIDARVSAALAAAKAMGDVAAAAIASQNTMATIAHETQVSG